MAFLQSATYIPLHTPNPYRNVSQLEEEKGLEEGASIAVLPCPVTVVFMLFSLPPAQPNMQTRSTTSWKGAVPETQVRTENSYSLFHTSCVCDLCIFLCAYSQGTELAHISVPEQLHIQSNFGIAVVLQKPIYHINLTHPLFKVRSV